MPEEPVQAQLETCNPLGEPLEETLKTHPFCRGLHAAHLRLIAARGSVQDVSAGRYLWRQGERAVETYLVLEGEIALEIAVPHEGKLGFDTVTAGGMAGCPALFGNGLWRFDGRAVSAVRAVVLDSASLRAAIEADHEFGYRMLERCTNFLGTTLNASRFRLVEAHSATLP
jgi:CRP-like cAMP-binding protein